MRRYDLIVIGSGPAGRRAAVQAAKLRKSVLVVEKGRRIGGVCVHTGTIPSKTLRETVLNLSGWRERGLYGRAYRAKQDITAADLGRRLRVTLDHEVDVLEHQFARNQVTWIEGAARFVDPHTIEVASDEGVQRYRSETFIVAVGTVPHRPAHIPFDGEVILDADQILDVKHIPRSLAVIGASVIGVEYATIYSALDVKVTLIEPTAGPLPFLDRELVEEFIHDMRERGMVLRFQSHVTAVKRLPDGQCSVEIEGGREVHADMVLFAAGRQGAVEGLNLEACGLKADERGRIAVDKTTFRTAVPHIFAVGDVIGFPSLASTSMEQGRIAACTAFDEPHAAPPAHFPYGIYSVPEISTAGLTEEEAHAQRIPFETGVGRFRETARGHIMGIESGFLKLIFARDTRRLLGVHILGEGATELVHIGQAVLNLGGTLDYFVDNTFNYPTLAEAYKVAALDAFNRLPRAHAKAEAAPGR